MSELPKTIFVAPESFDDWTAGEWSVEGGDTLLNGDVQEPYLRADTAIPRTEADAMVAAAYTKAAEWLKADDGVPVDGAWIGRVDRTPDQRSEAIFAMASDDARAALDAIVREERERLVPTLAALLKLYVDLAASGDCGNWDPEGDDEVIAARAALATIREEPTS